MLFAGQNSQQDFSGMLQGVIEIHNLDGAGKTKPPHVGQANGSVDEQHHLGGQGQASTDGLLPQQRTELIDGSKGGHIGGRFVVAHGMTLFVAGVLGENTAQIRHAGFGAAVGLFARPPLEFLFAHGHPGTIATDIQNRHGLAPLQRLEGFPILPALCCLAHRFHEPLNLASRDVDATGFLQMVLGLLVAGLIGSLQAYQSCQSRSAATLQPERGIGRIMSLLFAFVVGLETHVQLKTNAKISCGRANEFGEHYGCGLTMRVDRDIVLRKYER
jgi:hypothetical protein